MDEIESILLVWVTMGDERICPDCLQNSKLPPMNYYDWEERGFPASGSTVCGDRCRCGLVPGNIIQIFPNLRGSPINLRSDKTLVIRDPLVYADYAKLDELIYTYKQQTNGAKLPKKYYDLPDVLDRIEFLESIVILPAVVPDDKRN